MEVATYLTIRVERTFSDTIRRNLLRWSLVMCQLEVAEVLKKGLTLQKGYPRQLISRFEQVGKFYLTITPVH